MNRTQLIRLAYANPALRAGLLPLLKDASSLDQARVYADKFMEGPLTPEDVAGHRHVLRESQDVLQAIARLDRMFTGDTHRAFQELANPLVTFVKVIQVPMAIVPEPVQPTFKLKLR